MKKTKQKLLVIALLFFGITSFGFGQNVKVLNYTGNTYTSGKSFYVSIGASMQVTTDWTFEGWLYIDNKGAGEFPAVMDRRNVFSWYLIDNPGSNYAVRFVARNDSDNIIASLRSDGTDGSTDIELSFDTWHHVAISRDGTTARLFIDGTLADSSTDPDFVLSTPSGNSVNYAARYWGSKSRILDGALDEMRYSNIARYTAPFSINTESAPHPPSGDNNTILLFNFDANSLANTTDENSYAATSSGTPVYADWDGLAAALPLPIILTTFSAQAERNSVNLQWTTASESNNQGFDVQRSLDGQNWEKIGFVAGTGNSNKIQEYQFVDKEPAKRNYYRLKQIDFDGKTDFSHIVSAFFAKANISVYPNPAQDVLFVNSTDDVNMAYRIFDLTGKMMVAGATNDGRIEISDLSKGLYILNLTSKTSNLSLKIQVE